MEYTLIIIWILFGVLNIGIVGGYFYNHFYRIKEHVQVGHVMFLGFLFGPAATLPMLFLSNFLSYGLQFGRNGKTFLAREKNVL